MVAVNYAHVSNPARRGRGEQIAKGVIGGAIAGLAATWAMGEFQSLLPAEPPRRARSPIRFWRSERSSQRNRRRGLPRATARTWDQPATARVADAIARRTTGDSLSAGQRAIAGPVLHYAFGFAAGGLYGALAEEFRVAQAGHGTLFGALVWLLADEVAMPALRISPPPTKVPLATHASSLAGHLVFGLTAETLRRLFRGR